MARKFKKLFLLGLLATLGANGPLQATTEKKAEPSAHKSGKQSARDSGKHVANKPASHARVSPAAKPKPVKLSESAKVARPAKVAHVDQAPRKPLRRVALTDDDPVRLALHSASALVVDQASGQALVEKQANTVVPIASISKLMTAMVALDARPDMQELITISDEDVDSLKGTRSRIPVGTVMTRETAMLLALMSSENRAANALGRHYPGGLAAFVKAMNRKAQALGMLSSRFEEPTGLSSNNVSTAHDLARMVAAAARYPEIRAFSTTADARVEIHGGVREFHNTNALVRSDNWQIGVSKTGYISEAGRCLVMQARVADKPVVIVLLDSNGKMTRVGDAIRIKRWMESASIGRDRRHA